MQCPACNSASPDDARFCLRCGHYLGEPDEITRVNARVAEPKQRDWFSNALPIAGIGLALLAIGVIIAVMAIQRSDGIRSDLPNNNRLAALATPTPLPTLRPTPTAEPTPTPTPA